MPVVQRCFHDFIIIHHFVYSTVSVWGRLTAFCRVLIRFFLVLDYFRASIISVTEIYYRISGSFMCMCDLFACVCAWGASVYSLIGRTFLESAQNLTLEKSQDRPKSQTRNG